MKAHEKLVNRTVATGSRSAPLKSAKRFSALISKNTRGSQKFTKKCWKFEARGGHLTRDCTRYWDADSVVGRSSFPVIFSSLTKNRHHKRTNNKKKQGKKEQNYKDVWKLDNKKLVSCLEWPEIIIKESGKALDFGQLSGEHHVSEVEIISDFSEYFFIFLYFECSRTIYKEIQSESIERRRSYVSF